MGLWIVGIAGFFGYNYDGYRHAVVALQNKYLYDVTFDIHDHIVSLTVLASFGYPITALTAWNDLTTGPHAAVGVGNNHLYEFSYRNYGWVDRWTAGTTILDIAGYGNDSGGSQDNHIIANTNNGDLYDLTWYSSTNSTTNFGWIYQGSTTCQLTGIVGLTAYQERGVYGDSHAVAWGNTSNNECDLFFNADPVAPTFIRSPASPGTLAARSWPSPVSTYRPISAGEHQPPAYGDVERRCLRHLDAEQHAILCFVFLGNY